MRVFVAGGTGVVGRRAVPALVARGHDVTVLARSPERAEAVRALGAVPAHTSLFDVSGLRAAVVGHEVVVNLATSIPPFSKAARAAAWEANDRILAAAVGRARLRPVPTFVVRLMGSRLAHGARSQRVSNGALRAASSWRPGCPLVRTCLPDVVGATTGRRR